MSHKTIILAMPPTNGLVELIEENLKFHGFKVLRVDSILQFKYKNLMERLCQFFYKQIYRNNRYKKQLKDKQSLFKAQKLLSDIQYEYTLVIRPDIFSEQVLTLLKKHTKRKLIGYQWDGLKRFPVKNIIHLFDQFFVFDNNDLTNPDYKHVQLKCTTNFYFDMIKPNKNQNKKLLAYYIGDHQACRVNAIEKCAEKLKENGINIKFIIPTSKTSDIKCYQSNNIIFGKINRLSYNDNLKNVNEADILVDFVIARHNGLSFRHFEALYFKKKLITTNKHIKSYDFYHPNNIFIWDGENLDNLNEFLNKPIVPISSQIVEKYSFKKWINSILEIEEI